jgi:hypothetical protein
MKPKITDEIADDELDEIEQRCNAATAGPWRSSVEGRDHQSGSSFIRTGTDSTRADDIEMSGASIADYDFIAHARQDLPRLVEAVRALKARIQRSS